MYILEVKMENRFRTLIKDNANLVILVVVSAALLAIGLLRIFGVSDSPKISTTMAVAVTVIAALALVAIAYLGFSERKPRRSNKPSQAPHNSNSRRR